MRQNSLLNLLVCSNQNASISFLIGQGNLLLISIALLCFFLFQRSSLTNLAKMKMSSWKQDHSFPYFSRLFSPRLPCKENVTNQSGIIITYDHLIGLALYSFDFRYGLFAHSICQMNRHHQPSGWWVVGKGKPPANQPPKPNRCQLFWLARSLVLLPRVSVKATKLFMSHPSAEYSLPPSVVRCPFWQCESPFCSVRSNCRQEICPLKANASLWRPVWSPSEFQ